MLPEDFPGFNALPMHRSGSRIKASYAGPRSSVGSASDPRARGPGFDTRSDHIFSFLLPPIREGQEVVSYWRRYVHEVLANR